MIRRPDPTAAKDLEIAELRAELAELKTDKYRAQREVAQMRATAEAIDSESPDCDDICALKQEVEDATCDLLKVQSLIKNELDCGRKWSQKFCANGLNDELCLIKEIMNAKLCILEEDLAIAAYNLAYCHAQNATDYMNQRKALLTDMANDNPDLDPRCNNYIEQILVLSCA